MENKGNKGSTFILLLLFVILALTAVIRLVSLYSSGGGKYSDPVVSTKNVRGSIYDRHGNLLAFDTTRKGFLLLSGEKSQECAFLISRFTSLDSLSVTASIEDGVTFFPVSDDLIEEAAKALLSSSLTSVLTLTGRTARVTPYSSMNAVIGKAVNGRTGEGGIEEAFNSYLSVSPALGEKAVYGEDLVLTIDINYEEILTSVLSRSGYSGSAALLNRKGEIIAWYGDVSGKLLGNICYSHSTREETVLFSREEYIPLEECIQLSPLYLYLSVADECVVAALKGELGL